MLSSAPSQSKNPIKQCGILAGVLIGLFVLLCLPAYLSIGTKAVEGLAYATILCLIPGIIVLLISGLFFREAAPVAVMAISTLVRLMIVGIGTVLILNLRSDFGLPEFLIWLLICYFASLLVETLLIIR
ncbi:hypothetical protein [Gimesia aquarii]|uniref:Uncharacterized protein n=1 Tax=Gimesia aquarii TaxID=2527964 RepID=A0A517VWM1_9PLAN|nr:hypothetical protein [Gimesia aquarii]QDT97398.1 hypothetical protein V144x_28730 [Gimesia aquarii]